MPNGKAVQGPDFHFDGQNFAKVYDIKFLDKNGKEQYVFQNTWAISTRMLGVMFAVHSDSKGLVLPPNVAPEKVVIVPILFEETKEKVMKQAKKIKKTLENYGCILDAREEYKPGFKFNEWELKGVPIRIEIGPKDLEKKSVILVRRDSGKKEAVKTKNLKKKVKDLLGVIQNDLLNKAEKILKEAIVKVSDLNGVRKAIKNKKIALSPLCNSRVCENNLKDKTNGVKVLNILDKQPKELGKSICIVCGKKADYYAYTGKSY